MAPRRKHTTESTQARSPSASESAVPATQGDYLLMSSQSEKALRRAIALLKSISTGEGDEERAITVAIASLDADVAKLIAEREAFLAEQTAIASPSEAQVNEIVGLAKKLDALTANAQAAKSIIAAATQIFKIWSDRP